MTELTSEERAKIESDNTQAESVSSENGGVNQVQPEESQDDYGYFPEYARPIQEELVYEWQAPTRPYKKHSEAFYRNIIVLVALISIILFFSNQIMLMIVVWAIAGLRLLMTWVPPQVENYQITTFGLRIGQELYYWEEMSLFWFTDVYKQNQVNFEIARFPNRISLPLGESDVELMRAILVEVLVEGKPQPTYYEQVADWLSTTIPLDIDETTKQKSSSDTHHSKEIKEQPENTK